VSRTFAHDADGPENPPPFQRRVVLGGWQSAGLFAMASVPLLALAQLLGDRVSSHRLEHDGWVLNAEVPACARDGHAVQITVSLHRAEGTAPAPVAAVELSPDYVARFSDVKRRPVVFARLEKNAEPPLSPVTIDLTPSRYGRARGRLGVTTETGERLELELNTFVFP
jgi:hypothetical protein